MCFSIKHFCDFPGINNTKRDCASLVQSPMIVVINLPVYVSPVSPVSPFGVSPVFLVMVAVSAANPESLPGLLDSWVSLAESALAAACFCTCVTGYTDHQTIVNYQSHCINS